MNMGLSALDRFDLDVAALDRVEEPIERRDAIAAVPLREVRQAENLSSPVVGKTA
jgi:hypothetical protein